ncbi:MAG: hypothetical protein J7L51_03165, partial [Desulfurococcales archaeon]|nr:hypothetical protein [Desulfurococcales archaeon]
MGFRYGPLAAALLIVGLLAGAFAGSNLVPKYVTVTSTETVTTTSPITTTLTSTRYVTVTNTLTETLTEAETVTKTKIKRVTTTLTTTQFRTETLTVTKINTVTQTRILTTTSVVTTTVTTTITTKIRPLSITRFFDIHLIVNDTWARVTVEIPLTYIEKYLGRRVVIYVGQEAQVLRKLV